jgi:diguanylate cyclase
MNYPETPEAASKFALSALKRMKELGLAANPVNFAIWYEYFAGKNDNLNKSVDQMVSGEENRDPAGYNALYKRFIVAGQSAALDKGWSDRIEAVTDRIVAALSTTGSNTEEFGEALQTFSGGVEKADSIEQVHDLVVDIVEETNAMDARSKELHLQVTNSANEISELQEALEASRRDALTDGLTGIANRKCFDQELHEAIENANAEGEALSLVIADLDHFKLFNDTHGHQPGDQVLRLIGRILHESIKGKDIAARYGGEEFAIILPETTGGGAIAVAENIRKSVASKRIKKKGSDDEIGNITVSLGVTSYQPGESANDFIERADKALYLAKKLGRNRVMCEDVHRPKAVATGG